MGRAKLKLLSRRKLLSINSSDPSQPDILEEDSGEEVKATSADSALTLNRSLL